MTSIFHLCAFKGQVPKNPNPTQYMIPQNVGLHIELFKVDYFNINYRHMPRVLGLISCQKLPTFEEACKVNCRRERILSFMGNVLQAFIPG